MERRTAWAMADLILGLILMTFAVLYAADGASVRSLVDGILATILLGDARRSLLAVFKDWGTDAR